LCCAGEQYSKALLAIINFAQSAHTDDTEGVEDMSPGLPDSERATPGDNQSNSSLSREARRAKRVSLFDRIEKELPSLSPDRFPKTIQLFPNLPKKIN